MAAHTKEALAKAALAKEALANGVAGVAGGMEGAAGGVPAPCLTILYDGGCPLCLREVNLLRRRDRALHGEAAILAFVDVDAPDYDPGAHAGIDYRRAMERIHAIDGQGLVLRDVEVFRRAYGLVGLGWVYAPTRWPLVGSLVEVLYRAWAAWRLRLTRRPDLEELCRGRCQLQQGGISQPLPRRI